MKVCEKCHDKHDEKGRYCIECQEIRKKQKTKEKKHTESIYGTARWKKIHNIKKKNNPLCETCLKKGIVTPMDLADHIKEILDGGKPFDINNTQSLCVKCHAKKTAKERKKRNRYVKK